MPKRSCPFEEDIVTQSKLKITEKLVNNGTMRNECMKMIHEKTLQLLFTGAKNQVNNNISSKSPGVLQMDTEFKLPNTQMKISNTGLLLTPDTKTLNLSFTSNICSCTHKKKSQSKCNYCENFLCDICTKSCHKCSKDFCDRCTFSGDDLDICLSCY